MLERYESLKKEIQALESLIVAFSGGVDSSLLLKAAHDALGEKALGITVTTPYMAEREIKEAIAFAKEIGARHEVLSFPWIPALKENPTNRCYLCKHALFSSLKKLAYQRGFAHIAEGSNLDDTKEERPGRIALQELGIATPLLSLGLSKNEIRQISKELSLKSWNRPSYACLLTRFPHNRPLLEEEIEMVEQAEEFLISLGYGRVRVRFHEELAKIELEPKMMERLISSQEERTKVILFLRTLGFSRVALDIAGYKDEALHQGISCKPKRS
ncbi:ATP-dependent sacrificial sulfur transferase LarE [Wolinella succinogenes]|uniref:ATP-dependent sacrificial sulfur transferase LarE n=1 Tax=Wolinella succinogenes TaxID=844 RepID=UPI002FC5A1B4